MLEELQALEIEFKMAGYSDDTIEQIKRLNNATITKEYIENLESEKSYWGEN